MWTEVAGSTYPDGIVFDQDYDTVAAWDRAARDVLDDAITQYRKHNP